MSNSNAFEVSSVLSPEQKEKYQDFVVIALSGFDASGKGLHALWEAFTNIIPKEKLIVEPSITTSASMSESVKNEERYARIAGSLIEKCSATDKILIVGHSLGGAETLQLLRALVEDKRTQGKTIETVIFSPLGYGTSGLRAFADLLWGSVAINLNPNIREAEFMYPQSDAVGVSDQEKAYKKSVLQKILEKQGKNSEDFFHQIEEIDLKLHAQSGDRALLLQKRQQLLAPHFADLVKHATHLSEEQLQDIDERTREKEAKDLRAWLTEFRIFAFNMIADLYKGFDGALDEIQQKAQENNITIRTTMVEMVKDVLVSKEQIDLAKQISMKNALVSWLTINASHFVASWDGLTVLETVTQALERS